MAKDLCIAGHETWRDSSLYGGGTWWEEILRRIAECDIFIALISRDAVNSTACQRELDWAEALGKPLIAVAVERIAFALPTGLSRGQVVDYSNPYSAQAGLALEEALATLPAAPRLRSPLPDPPAVPLAYLSDLIALVTFEQVLDHDQQRHIVRELEFALNSADPEALLLPRNDPHARRMAQPQFTRRQRVVRQLTVGVNWLKS